MKFPAILALALLASPAFAVDKLLINEVHLNPPGTVNATDGDSNYEFVEMVAVDSSGNPIANFDCTGYWLLVVDSNGSTAGEVNEAWNLTGLKTGANGLLLLGDGYDNAPVGGPWSSYIAAATTAVGDPSGMGGDNLNDNDAFSLLLVKDFVGIPDPGDAGAGTDVDSNNDRVLGPYVHNPQISLAATATPPWSSVVDSVGIPERRDAIDGLDRPPYATANLTAGAVLAEASQWDPSSFARKRNANGTVDMGNTAASWYGGDFDSGVPIITVAYRSDRHFGLLNAQNQSAPGEVTPGLPNLIVAPPTAELRINEVHINPDDANRDGDSDSNYEFVEIASTNRNNASLAGLTLVLVDSSTTDGGALVGAVTVPNANVGEIVEAWPLSGLTTGTNGLTLVGNNYTQTHTPWGNYVDSATIVGSPSGMGDSNIPNAGLSLFLVRNFTAVARTSAALGADVDANDDGVIDSPASAFGPSAVIVDSIGFNMNGVTTNVPGKSYATVTVPVTATDHPHSIARIAGNASVSASAWVGGQMGARDRSGIDYRTGPIFGSFRGQVTPGRVNPAAEPAVATDIRLNEIHLGPAGSGGAAGYVELASTTRGIAPMNGLYLLVIDNAPPAVGTIETVVDLRGQSTGFSGLAVFADGAEEGKNDDLIGWFWRGAVSVKTVREDPQSYNVDGSTNTAFNIGPSDLAPNNGRIYLLVTNFTGANGADLDTDDNGTFETSPWTSIVDGVAFGAPVTTPGIASLGAPGFDVQNISRYPRQWTAGSAAQWYFGELAGPDPAAVLYTSNFSGSYKGAASPGRQNHAATPGGGSPVINEVVINPPGGDSNKEFVEFASPSGGAESMNGLTLLLVDSGTGANNTGNVGNVLEAISLDGYATGSNGLLMAGAGYTNAAAVPYTGANAPAAGTAFADPIELQPDEIGLDTDNGALTFLLVRDWTGNVDEDLDTVGSYVSPAPTTPPGDGVIDASPLPYSSIVDSAGLRFWNASAVPPALQGVLYSLANLSQTGFTPDTIARKRGSLTANNAAAWYGGDLAADGIAYDAVQKFPAGFTGKVTPGQPNVVDSTWYEADDDSDTVKNFVEEATGMNPTQSDANKLPSVGSIDISGTVYPTLTFKKLKSDPSYTYAIETSTDLMTWTSGNTTQVSATDDAGGTTQTIVVRPSDAYFGGLAAEGKKVFIRLRITHS